MSDVPASESSPIGFTPARIAGLELKNRLIKAATYEGKSPGGIPGKELSDFHSRIALGGVAMTTIAYCSTEADGRMHGGNMYVHEGISSELTSLADAVHAGGARISAQLTHCGAFSKNRELENLKRPLGPSRGLNMLGAPNGVPLAGAMKLSDIDHVVGTFADSASLMKRVGFDAVEIHFGHGYGLSQFISPRTNKRTDEYGGSHENRMRFPVRVLEAVRSAVGDDFPVIGKMSMADGVRPGVDWDEGVRVAETLDRAGIDALVTSGGTSSFNPMLMFRGASMADGMIAQEKNPLMRLALKVVGPKLFKPYPYEDLYFREKALRIREKVGCKLIYIGGCSSAANLETILADGFDFAQLGRTLLADPDFAKHAEADPAYRNPCTHCNQCVGLIEAPGGIKCVDATALSGRAELRRAQ